MRSKIQFGLFIGSLLSLFSGTAIAAPPTFNAETCSDIVAGFETIQASAPTLLIRPSADGKTFGFEYSGGSFSVDRSAYLRLLRNFVGSKVYVKMAITLYGMRSDGTLDYDHPSVKYISTGRHCDAYEFSRRFSPDSPTTGDGEPLRYENAKQSKFFLKTACDVLVDEKAKARMTAFNAATANPTSGPSTDATTLVAKPEFEAAPVVSIPAAASISESAI